MVLTTSCNRLKRILFLFLVIDIIFFVKILAGVAIVIFEKEDFVCEEVAKTEFWFNQNISYKRIQN